MRIIKIGTVKKGMSRNWIFTTIGLLLWHANIVAATIPMSSAWNLGRNPDGKPIISPLLTEWDSSQDPNYIFYQGLPNISKTFSLNPHLSKFVPLISFSATATPAQFTAGRTDINHLFMQWSATPIFVHFGGSQSEGQVLAPTPGFIRAAHKNGAMILGSIFLSPPVFGGDKEIEWVKDMLKQQADGSFFYADQLIKIAHAYHFDGYFLNQEAILYDQIIDKKFVTFINYFHQQAPDLLIDWYQIPAYSATTQFLQPGTEVFLDYGASMDRWVQSAKTVNFPLENIEYGINGSNVYTLSNMTRYLNDAVKYQLSIGQFATEKIATQGSSQTTLETALKRVDLFWNGDATLTGVNGYLQQRSAITELPFFTDFNVGQGTDFFIDGNRTDLGNWHSTELQAILPRLQHSPIFTFQYDLSNAFSGGSALAISVSPHESVESYTLFYTELTATKKNTIFSAVYQGSDGTDTLCVIYKNGNENCIKLLANKQWQRSEIKLDDNLNQTMTAVALYSIANTSAHTIHLGQIYIGEKQTLSPRFIDVKMTAHLGKNFIEWQPIKDANYFDIYISENGYQQLIARTLNTFFCIDGYPQGSYLVKANAFDVKND